MRYKLLINFLRSQLVSPLVLFFYLYVAILLTFRYFSLLFLNLKANCSSWCFWFWRSHSLSARVSKFLWCIFSIPANSTIRLLITCRTLTLAFGFGYLKSHFKHFYAKSENIHIYFHMMLTAIYWLSMWIKT